MSHIQMSQTQMSHGPILAIDLGNSRAKCGLFPGLTGSSTSSQSGELPECRDVLSISHRDPLPWNSLRDWLTRCAGHWLAALSSVSPTATQQWLTSWPSDLGPPPQVLTAASQPPLPFRVQYPEKVGADRVANAVAANLARAEGHAAIVVDSGTATTLEVISAEGEFLGGAIVPGLELAAQSLHDHTALLPLLDWPTLSVTPQAIGNQTQSAMHSGLFWGQVGAIQELLSRTEQELGGKVDLFITGGTAPVFAKHLSPRIRLIPELTLQGIALWALQTHQQTHHLSSQAGTH